MATHGAAGATAGGCPSSITGLSDSFGADLSLEAGAGGGKRVDRDIFVYVDGLGVLTEVVEAGEATGTVALEGSLASVFPVVRYTLEDSS